MLIFQRKNNQQANTLRRIVDSGGNRVTATEPPPQLLLGLGEFYVKERGISAQFFEPLQGLTRFYPWDQVPFGLSAVRALASSEDSELLNRLVRRLGLSVQDCELLGLEATSPDGESTGENSKIDSIKSDAKRLLSWSFRIADWCPDMNVATALRSIREMDVTETDRYVRAVLG